MEEAGEKKDDDNQKTMSDSPPEQVEHVTPAVTKARTDAAITIVKSKAANPLTIATAGSPTLAVHQGGSSTRGGTDGHPPPRFCKNCCAALLPEDHVCPRCGMLVDSVAAHREYIMGILQL